jgi:hypothetical protein
MHFRTMAAMSTKDHELFLNHVKGKMTGGQARPCPFCGGTDWGTAGIAGFIVYEPNQSHQIAAETFPVALFICQGCYFVQHFAWQLILKDGGRDDGATMRVVGPATGQDPS